MNNIDKMISNILLEEIDKKSKDKSNKFGEWMEIDGSKLRGKQKNLDVAEPKGKLTAADFKALRKGAKRKNFDEEKVKGNLRGKQKNLDVAEPKGKLTAADFKALRSGSKNKKKNVKLTESDLIYLIQRVVNEAESKGKSKSNISKKEPAGLKKTNTVLGLSKKENDNYLNGVSKKMGDYLKNMGGDKYETNPSSFPRANNSKNKKAYQASDAVEEYIENFAYPAFPDYDEIKPNEDWVSSNIEGSSKTGNNPKWANAEETSFGKKFNNTRKKDLYNKEKKRSYKRVTQPIDTAGEHSGEKSIDKMFSKLESVDNKKNVINEEMSRMKNIINYNSKTQ